MPVGGCEGGILIEVSEVAVGATVHMTQIKMLP
jgi:hypothetical protein